MSALLDSLLAGHEGPAAQAITSAGLPGPRSEAWKYTSLRALERRTFMAAQPVAVDAALLASIPAPRIVFVNGHFDASLSMLGALPRGLRIDTSETGSAPTATLETRSGDEVFAALNVLLARGGARIHAEGDIQTPLHLVQVGRSGDADIASHLRHAITLEAGASLTLLEHHVADGTHAHLANDHLDVVLGEGAKLRHLRVQDDALAASRVLRSDATLATRARYVRLDFELGAALSRHELNVRLDGEGATVEAGGVLLADGRRHLDTRLQITHAAKDTRSALPWRGLADGRGRVAFHGGIRIDAGADGSQADLQNRNLLLAEGAEIDTQPVLVIHADEVQAAHGATVGQLDATALFYLRSRGIGEFQARRILTAAFCRDLLSVIDDAAVRTLVEARLDGALARMQDA